MLLPFPLSIGFAFSEWIAAITLMSGVVVYAVIVNGLTTIERDHEEDAT